MYDAVRAAPAGRATPAHFTRRLADLGYDGVVIRNGDVLGGSDDHDGEGVDATAETPTAATIRERHGIDVVDGYEVRADGPESASGHVGNYRRSCTLLLVRGGSPEMNRFAVESERVDVLTAPLAGNGDLNHVIADAARENGVRIEIDLSPVLRAAGGERVQAIAALRRLREVVEARDAPVVVTAGADSHLGVRAPREVIAVGEAVGFDAATIEAGLREWGRLADRNRERRRDRFVAPGVRRGRYDSDDDPRGDR